MINLFDPKKTKKLIGFNKNFSFLKNLIISEKLPKILMLSGEKGIGKFTFINHFLHYYFDKDNYDENKYEIIKENNFFLKNFRNLFPNIEYIQPSSTKKILVEDIRKLKINLLKTSYIDGKRFIILDDVETFNINSLNALLKIIEEPNKENYFILINNKTKPLIETIKSRCLEIKIFLKQKEKVDISLFLLKYFNQKNMLNPDKVEISPAFFLKFNNFFLEKKINLNDKFINNLNLILNYYKKEKDTIYKDLIIFYIDYYLKDKKINIKKNIEKRIFLLKSVNDFFAYNLNSNSLLNSIETKFFYE